MLKTFQALNTQQLYPIYRKHDLSSSLEGKKNFVTNFTTKRFSWQKFSPMSTTFRKPAHHPTHNKKGLKYILTRLLSDTNVVNIQRTLKLKKMQTQ